MYICKWTIAVISGKLSELIHKHEGQGHRGSNKGQPGIQRTISEHDLKSKSDRNINIQVI